MYESTRRNPLIAVTHDYRDDGLVAELRGLRASGDLVEPPGWVRDRARRLFRQGTSAKPSLISRIKATLAFDSRQPGLRPAGIRSAGILDTLAEGPWQLLYRGGDVDVDLLVKPNQDGRTLTVRGQALSVAGDDFGAHGVVEALPADVPKRLHGVAEPSAVSDLEPTGEFALSNLERGRYDVLLRFGAREIELSGVEL
jgi:hypothetical protein